MRRFTILMAFLLIACSLALHAQGTQIKGKVTSSEDGSTLPGATVMVKGTSNVTVTDADGNYTLTIAPEATTLTVSFVGMKTKNVEIAGQTIVNIIMEPEMKNIDEVVVTAMGLKRSEKSLGYSATQVTSEEISQSKVHSVLNSLEGKVAGVNITTGSGAPGASTKIILRGYSTMRENNQPLFIVDGVPINNDQVASTSAASTSPINFNESDKAVDFGNRANDINPEDIESLTILKGAAASAQYGSRAANGVIVITTKSGKEGEKLKVEYSGAMNLSTPLRLPQFQQVFGQGWLGLQDLTQNGSWGPALDGKMRVWGNIVDNTQMLKPYVAVPNNLKDFYEMGKSYNNSLTFSGGGANTSYYVSYANDNEDGIIPGRVDSYNRNTFAAKGTLKDKRLTINAGINYISKQAKYVPAGQGGSAGNVLYEDLLQIPVDLSIVDMKDYHNKFFNLNNYYTPYAGNPYRSLSENSNSFNEDRIIGSILLEYELSKWLTAHWRIGSDVSNSQRKDWVAIAIPDLSGYNGSLAPVPGSVYQRTFHSEDLNSNFFLTSNNKVGDDLKLNLLAGYEAVQQSHFDLGTQVKNLDIPYYYNIQNSSKTPLSVTDESKKRLFGIYGLAEIAFKEYLFATITARNDWSSTLPSDNNSYFYPGLSISFLLSDAVPQIKDIFPFWKIRASIGKTGNDADPYLIKNVYVPGLINLDYGQLRFPMNGVNGFRISNTLGNPKLKPELTTEWELGTEMWLIDKRIGLDLTYYDRKTKDLITDVPLAPSSGYGDQYQNIGEIENKGIEVMFTLVPLKSNDFQWETQINYTVNRGKLLKLTNGLTKVEITHAYDVYFYVEPGMPIGVFEGPVPQTDGKGHIVVDPSTGIPLQQANKGIYGDAEAKFMLGMTNKFTYKNLSLSCLFDVRRGGLIYSGTADLTYFVGNATKSLYNNRQPFVVPNSVIQVVDANGDPVLVNGQPVYKENSIPIDMQHMDSYYYQTTNKISERNNVLIKSYVKLRELTLTYAFPKSWFTNMPIKGLNLGIVGRNLLLWTPKSNNFIDPETTTFGNDLSADFGEFRGGPTVRSFGFNLRATF